MANANPTDWAPLDPAFLTNDAQTQSAVLSVLLAERPVQLTVSELARELTTDPDDFAEKDAVERAIRHLVGVGLLHRHGTFILPSRAALCLQELEVRGTEDEVRGGQC